MNDAAVQSDILSRFPPGALLDVQFRRADNTKVLGLLEPGEVNVRLVPRGPEEFNADPGKAPVEVCEQVVEEFVYEHYAVIQVLRKDLPALLTERLYSLMAIYGGFAHGLTAHEPPPGEPRLVPVMTRLAPSDLETLDLLITAGLAGSRAEAMRWCLGRIRQWPEYQERTGGAYRG
jgi:hypothetical protein